MRVVFKGSHVPDKQLVSMMLDLISHSLQVQGFTNE
jgi:hypothetical protein